MRAAPVSVAKSMISAGLGFGGVGQCVAQHQRGPRRRCCPTSTRRPWRVASTSPGRIGVAGRSRSPPPAPAAADAPAASAPSPAAARPSACAAPPMSFFMLRMPSAPLMSRPPVSKHTPLPTMASVGCSGVAPVAARSGAGARWLARPTAWMAGKLCLSSDFAFDHASGRRRSPGPGVRAAPSSSAGPMCSVGVLIRSRTRVLAASRARLRRRRPGRARAPGAPARAPASRSGRTGRRPGPSPAGPGPQAASPATSGDRR